MPNFSLAAAPARRLFVVCVCCVVGVCCVGCSGFEADAPPVDEGVMVAVLMDLHLADARQSMVQDLRPGVRDSILTAHGLDERAYRAAVGYYAQHPERYVALYDTVLDRLNSQAGFGMPRGETPPKPAVPLDR